MATLIKNANIATDSWQRLDWAADGSLPAVPPAGDVLIPLGVVLAAAVFAAGYSMVRKLYTDSTLRLYRQGPDANKH